MNRSFETDMQMPGTARQHERASRMIVAADFQSAIAGSLVLNRPKCFPSLSGLAMADRRSAATLEVLFVEQNVLSSGFALDDLLIIHAVHGGFSGESGPSGAI